MAPLTVALLGLGEAGSALAGDLVAAGVFVRGFDPAAGHDVPGVHRAADARAAVDGSDVVLSVTAASAALEAAGGAAGGLRHGQVYADLNASGAALKRAVAEVVAPTGAQFADVALMGIVPRDGLRTPALVSGPGAEAFAERLRPLGMPVEILGDEPGAAATRKLLTLAILDAKHAEPGTEVTLVWGEEGGGTDKPTVEPHVQTEIRGVVAPVPIVGAVRSSYAPGGWRAAHA